MTNDARNSRGGLWRDLDESLSARLELARLELREMLLVWRRLVIALATAAVLALLAGALLIGALCDSLDGVGGLSALAWRLVLGVCFALAAIAGGWEAWRRFRREFVPFEETLEELREDRAWLREWLGRESTARDDDAP